MAILVDGRVAAGRDIADSFYSVQAYTGTPTFYRPSVGGQSNYLGQKKGIPRRWGVAPHPTKPGELAWRSCQPKVGGTALRTECSFGYEANTVTRFFLWKFVLAPAGHPDYWQSDTLSPYCIIGQWHEDQQPNGARPPPFAVAIIEDSNGLGLYISLAHDNGLNNSGTSVPATEVNTFVRYIERGVEYELGVRCRASGSVNTDFLNLWLDGQNVYNYTGYLGFTNGANNYFKIGTYDYIDQNAPITGRTLFFPGVLIGDQTETYASMAATYAGIPAQPVRQRPMVAVAVIGGSNARGNSGSGTIARSLLGQPCQDPVTPSTVAQYSLVPSLAQRLQERGFSVYSFNCAALGMGLSSFVGQCRGVYATTTTYLPGDTVIPASPVGANSYMPLGLKFICEVGGTSDGTVPTWPTTEYGQVTDGGLVWRAERRETYDVAGHTYTSGELGHDPLGLLNQAMLSVLQVPAAARRTLLLMPDLDPLQNTSTADALAEIREQGRRFGVEVVVSRELASGTATDYQLYQVGRRAADEL